MLKPETGILALYLPDSLLINTFCIFFGLVTEGVSSLLSYYVLFTTWSSYRALPAVGNEVIYQNHLPGNLLMMRFAYWRFNEAYFYKIGHQLGDGQKLPLVQKLRT